MIEYKDRPTPEPGSTWRHCRNGDLYTIVGMARYASGPGEADRLFIVYRSQKDGALWFRDLPDFMGQPESGAYRFEEVTS